MLYHTDLVSTAIHHELYGYYGQSDVVVIVGIGSNFETTTNRSRELLAEMLFKNEYPDATLKRFSNAIVICGVPDDCKSLARRVEANARDRESRFSAD